MAVEPDRIVDAAFRLFAESGYEATSVDDIAAAAGVSRSTFFRSYGSKEAVIFPDHDVILGLVEDRLRTSHADSALAAVTDAVKIVLSHYVAEGERARERYRLTSTVPALRERELLSGTRYQQVFRRYLSRWGDDSEAGELRAELMAAAVVAAHNRVLRRWLRGESENPHREVEQTLAVVRRVFEEGDTSPVAIVVVPEAAPIGDIEVAVRQAVERLGRPALPDPAGS
jgi:AcrR family transcriptional regulator